MPYWAAFYEFLGPRSSLIPQFYPIYMVFIFKLSLNDQQVPSKLPNIFRKWPGMLLEYNTQFNLNKHSYNKVSIFVCCCHTVAEGAGAGGGLSDIKMSSVICHLTIISDNNTRLPVLAAIYS